MDVSVFKVDVKHALAIPSPSLGFHGSTSTFFEQILDRIKSFLYTL